MEFKPSSYRSGFIGLGVVVGLAGLAFGLGSLIVSIGELSVHPFRLNSHWPMQDAPLIEQVPSV